MLVWNLQTDHDSSDIRNQGWMQLSITDSLQIHLITWKDINPNGQYVFTLITLCA